MINQSASSNSKRPAVGVQQPFSLYDVSGTQIAVSRHGSGTSIICLHATGHGGRDYEPFVTAMVPQGFEVLVVDWPGHGASPADASGAPVSAERYADILTDLVPSLCPGQRPILLGNSIGGAAALSFALDHPDKVRALVLCNPGGLAPLDVLAKAVIDLMVGFFAAGERGASWFPGAFSAYYRLVLPAKPARVQRSRIVAAGPELAPLLKQAWDSFRQSDADLRERATKLSVPAFFAWAKHDQIVSWSRSKGAVGNIPNAQVTMFKGGHSAFIEDPEAFVVTLCRFARTLPE